MDTVVKQTNTGKRMHSFENGVGKLYVKVKPSQITSSVSFSNGILVL